MVYSGQGDSAMAMLSSCPKVSLSSTRYDNPGDFIIDILGLDEGTEGEVICYDYGPGEEGQWHGTPIAQGGQVGMMSQGEGGWRSVLEDEGHAGASWPLASQLQQEQDEHKLSGHGEDEQGDEDVACYGEDGGGDGSEIDTGRSAGLTGCFTLDDIDSALNPEPSQHASPRSLASTSGTGTLSSNLTHILADYFYHSLAYVSLMRDIENSIARFEEMARPKSKSTSSRKSRGSTADMKNTLALINRGRQMVSGGLMGLPQQPEYSALDEDEDGSAVEMTDRRPRSPPTSHAEEAAEKNEEEEDEEEEIYLNEEHPPTATTGQRRSNRCKPLTSCKPLVGQAKTGYMLPPVLPDSFMGRGDTSGKGGWFDNMALQLWVLYSRRLTASFMFLALNNRLHFIISHHAY
jgi:hypothetical protein